MDTQMEKLLVAQERALQQKNEADRKAKQAKKQIEDLKRKRRTQRLIVPPNAPREYADRETLWNAVDAAETGENAQTTRRLIIALPKELTLEQNIALIRRYCQTTFVDKGMIADIAVHHSLPDGNPHAHILLTMRAMDERGQWLAKSKSTYALDEHGERIIGKNL